jgi:hypothetical protein
MEAKAPGNEDDSEENSEPTPDMQPDPGADTSDEDWDWLEGLSLSNAVVAETINAAIGSIIDASGIASMAGKAIEASGIMSAHSSSVASILDSAQVAGAFAPSASAITRTLATLPPVTGLNSSVVASILDSAQVAGAFAPSASAITRTLATLPPVTGLNSSVVASILDSAQVAGAFAPSASAIMNALTATFGSFFDTSRTASMLSAVVSSPTFMAAISGLQEPLLSSSEIRQDPSAWLGRYQTWTSRIPAPRAAGPESTRTVEQALIPDAVSEHWIKRYNDELMLAITLLTLVVAVLAWLFPRSTPTPVQVKVVCAVVQSCLGTHGVVAPSHGPADLPTHQPANSHGVKGHGGSGGGSR